MFVSRTNYSDEMLDWIFDRDSIWTEFSPSDPFSPFPECTIGKQHLPLGSGRMIRSNADCLIYGDFFDGSRDSGIFTPENLAQVTACALNFPCADQMSPKLVVGAVWSWDVNEPSSPFGCPVLKSNGRWATVNCSSVLPFACQSTVDPYDWKSKF